MKVRWLILCGIAAMLAGSADMAAALADPDARGWSKPQQPFRIYGNTYYVGTHGLSAILITSMQGHILLDGTLPANAPLIEANIRELGFRLRDVKLILNSHAHFDHAGAIAAIAHDTSTEVAASRHGAKALMLGGDDPDDPQHGEAPLFPKVPKVRGIADGESVHVGTLAVQAHDTPGHTPGSTTWNWTSCEGSRCLAMVYADSVTLFGTKGYRYGDPAHPERVRDFKRGLDVIAALPCDILMTPHPDVIDFQSRAASRQPGAAHDPLVDPSACRSFAEQGRQNLRERLAKEAAGTP